MIVSNHDEGIPNYGMSISMIVNINILGTYCFNREHKFVRLNLYHLSTLKILMVPRQEPTSRIVIQLVLYSSMYIEFILQAKS